jgi:peptidoglycan/LPS O-acetylase OafA/YrhL
MSKDTNLYLRQLDGIRFLAVTMVMIDHWSGDSLGFPLSYLGVCMFFVLSGFLITRILLNAKTKDEQSGRGHGFSLKQFYIRRTIRIFPIYYLTIFVLYLMHVKPVREHLAWCLTYSTNIYVAVHHTWLGIIDHLWSLAVEEQFYLFFPFVVFFVPNRYLLKVLYGFIALSLTLRMFFYLKGVIWMTPYVLMPTCLDAFGMGGILAYFFTKNNPKFKQFITNQVYLWMSLVVYILVLFWNKSVSGGQNYVTIIWLRLFESLLSLFVVGNAAYHFGGIMKSILESPIANYLGRISYGLYIYHFLIYNPYNNADIPNHPTVRILKKIPFIEQNLPIKIIFLYILTAFVATLSWFLIEKPINKWKDKFGY